MSLNYPTTLSANTLGDNLPLYVIGHNQEALNAAIVLASLDNTVQVVADTATIDDTLSNYRFEPQLTALWTLYSQQQRIQLLASDALDLPNHALVWLFWDSLGDDRRNGLVQLLQSPHQQVLISGISQVGQVAQFADRLASHWVYYLPLIFMKDGANFSSMLKPDMLLVGEKTADSHWQCSVLQFFIHHAQQHAMADIQTVEFARSAIMTMLATRVSLMNELSRLADSLGVNIHTVQAMMGLDSRIGQHFLAAGWGFGGRALPMELTLLKQQFDAHQVASQLVKAMIDINEDQKELIFRKFWRHFDGFIEHKTVVIWGAGYRSGTGRTTNSAIHPLLKLLWSYGITTYVYASNTAFELAQLYAKQPLFVCVNNPYNMLADADALLIINWSALQAPDIDRLNATPIPIFDAKNVIDNASKARLIADYYGIGR